MITIKSVDNGFIYTNESDYAEEGDKPTMMCFEDIEDHEGFIKMVEQLAEDCGFQYEKYKSNNFTCGFTKPGHKVEDKLE